MNVSPERLDPRQAPDIDAPRLRRFDTVLLTAMGDSGKIDSLDRRMTARPSDGDQSMELFVQSLAATAHCIIIIEFVIRLLQ